MGRSFRNRVPAARVVFGRGLGQSIGIYGTTAAEIGIATVEVAGDLEGMGAMLPETAEKIAAGLMLAARVARGEVLPTPLDDFLSKRKA